MTVVAAADGVGVQLHLTKPGTPYYDATRVINALHGLGVRHVRDSFHVGWTGLAAQITQVAATAGVKFTLTARYADPIDATVAGIAALGDAVEAVEGVNEWDHSGRPDWAAELRTHQGALYAAVKATMPSMPVLAPALGDPRLATTLGPVPCDLGNAHTYPNGFPDAPWQAICRTGAATVSGGKPLVVTETGYTNALHDPDVRYHHPVSEDVAAGYMPQLIAAHLDSGAQWVFVYELFDQGPGDTVSESCFGLIRNDGTPKPAHDVLRQALIITRRTETSDDARCSRCPGVMVLWSDRDKHTTHLT